MGFGPFFNRFFLLAGEALPLCYGENLFEEKNKFPYC